MKLIINYILKEEKIKNYFIFYEDKNDDYDIENYIKNSLYGRIDIRGINY